RHPRTSSPSTRKSRRFRPPFSVALTAQPSTPTIIYEHHTPHSSQPPIQGQSRQEFRGRVPHRLARLAWHFLERFRSRRPASHLCRPPSRTGPALSTRQRRRQQVHLARFVSARISQ